MIIQCNQQAFCAKEMQANIDKNKAGAFDSSMNKNKESFHAESNNNNIKGSDPLLHEIDQSKSEFMYISKAALCHKSSLFPDIKSTRYPHSHCHMRNLIKLGQVTII